MIVLQRRTSFVDVPQYLILFHFILKNEYSTFNHHLTFNHTFGIDQLKSRQFWGVVGVDVSIHDIKFGTLRSHSSGGILVFAQGFHDTPTYLACTFGNCR